MTDTDGPVELRLNRVLEAARVNAARGELLALILWMPERDLRELLSLARQLNRSAPVIELRSRRRG